MRRKEILGLVGLVIFLSVGTVWAHEHGQKVPGAPAHEESFLDIDTSLLGFQGTRDVFNVHPLFVHFPIALFPAAFLFYLIGFVLRRPPFSLAGRACLWLATLGIMLAVITGLQGEGSFPHNARIHDMMETHEMIGLWASAFAIILLGWSFLQKDHRPRGTVFFLILLVFVNYLILQNADIGGRMVFVEGAAVRSAVPVVTGKYRRVKRELREARQALREAEAQAPETMTEDPHDDHHSEVAPGEPGIDNNF